MIKLIAETQMTVDSLGKNFDRWQFKTIAEIAKTKSGGTPSRKKPEYFQGNIRWVKSGELENSWIFDTEEKITQEAVEKSNAKILPKGTLLMAMYGATVGKLGILGIEAATNQAICAIQPNELLDTNFLFYYLKSKRQVFLSQSFGGAQPNISQTLIKNIKIPIPHLIEQKRIVARVEANLNELKVIRSNIERMRENTDSLLAISLDDVFLKLNSVTDTLSLSEVAMVFNGRASGKGNSHVRVFKTRHVYPHFLKLENPSYMKVEQVQKMPQDRYIKTNDVLMANIAEGTLGRVSYVKKCEQFWTVDTQIMILRSKNEKRLLGKWLYYYLWSEYGQREILSRRSGIAFADKRGQTHIYPKNVAEIPVPLPPVNLQRQAVAHLDSVQNEVDEILKLLDKDTKSLDELEQSILERAFRGEL